MHKAALVPITAKTLYERMVIDLIDFTTKPSHGFRYILHVVDHYCKYHWAWALPDKRAITVAYYLDALFGFAFAPKYIQCDQGREFVPELLELLTKWGVPSINSAPYHPQTNGIVERYNGVLKVALRHWFIQEKTEDWYHQ